MSACAIARAVLMAEGTLLAALASDANEQRRRVVVGRMQQGLVPSLALEEISTVRLARVLRSGGTRLHRSRVQVTVIARNVAEKDVLVQRVRSAVGQTIGDYAGFTGVVVEVVGGGPEMPIDGGVLTQTVDLMVTYNGA